jgi:hypothetical protein
VTSFDLSIFTICDIRSISYILRCMPNLIRFKFFHALQLVAWPFGDEVVNGYVWREDIRN